MLRIDRRSIQNFDWSFLGIVAVLILCGLVNLASATHAGVEEGLSEGVRRQLMALGGGAFLLVVILMIDYRHFHRMALPIYVLSLALLALTLWLAPVTRGAQAWLFGGRLQPSEFAKIGLVLALARYFVRNPPGEMTQLRQFAIPALILALPVGLIVMQKDMGVALLTLLVGLTYLPLVRVPFRAWVAVSAVGAGALVAIWNFGLAAYQQKRILDFIDPSRDPLSSGYQAIQSRIAVGSGGVFGKGWLEGTQSQLNFLPTQHTDFAFSVLAEEWGFAGCFVILGFYLLMLLWGLWIARNSRDSFGTMLAVGLVGTLFWPAAINIAMVLGLAPVIGVPLPLFSYGGSAIVAASISVSLLLNISMRRWALI